MLADAPEAQRKAMVTERLKMIAAQPPEQRVESVKGILLAINKLHPKKKAEFIKTRTNVVAELPPDARKAIQVARVKAGTTIPKDINQSDMLHILATTLDWPNAKRTMFLDAIGAIFKEENLPMPNIKSLLEMAAATRQETQKPWWKFW